MLAFLVLLGVVCHVGHPVGDVKVYLILYFRLNLRQLFLQHVHCLLVQKLATQLEVLLVHESVGP